MPQKKLLGLTPFAKRFVEEYLTDYRQAAAYRRARDAHPEVEDHPGSVDQAASLLFHRPEVMEYYNECAAKLREDTVKQREQLLEIMKQQAIGDVSEFAVVRWLNCRYCWGEGHRYQYTPAEWERVVEEYTRRAEEADLDNRPAPSLPDYRGGVGFNRIAQPNPECPECQGEGIKDVLIKPTDEMSPGARAVFAGIKQTKDGIEIKTNSQEKAREWIAKYLNLFEEHEKAGAGEVHVHLDTKDSKA